MEPCTEVIGHDSPRVPLGEFLTPVRDEDCAIVLRYLEEIPCLKKAMFELANCDAHCTQEAVSNLRVCANLVLNMTQILRWGVVLDTGIAVEELMRLCDLHLHHGSRITAEGRDAIDDAKTETARAFDAALKMIGEDLPVSEEDCERMRQYIVDISTLKNVMVTLFRGEAHEAAKAAAHCTDQIETLQWEVLQDTHMALDELRKLCDEHADDNTILNEKDHYAIVGAKAKAQICFAEALCKISSFADALAKAQQQG